MGILLETARMTAPGAGIELDEREELAVQFALKNHGASEIDLVSGLHVNRLEAAYLIRRLISRHVLATDVIDHRHPLNQAMS